MSSLIQPLPDGPIDIVGDVHGEIDALRTLLRHLGYDDNGRHRSGRQLVFVGDLVNRGPDSPGVVDWVDNLIQSHLARCTLGNHELNILLGHRRPNSNWFYGEPQLDEAGRLIPQTMLDEPVRHRMQDWFRSLPLALIRNDLRIVHACWDADMIELARTETDVLQLFEHASERIEAELIDGEDDIQRELEHQNGNPVLKLTSGPVARLEMPLRQGDRVQYTRRVPWWNEYQDQAFCVFGHYSRLEGTFFGSPSCFCIDFGVGRRWIERQMGVTDSFAWKLAALRFPEREVVFDDGHREPCLMA